MITGTKDGSEYGMEMFQKWVAAGKPGKFADFIKAQDEREVKARREAAQAAAGGVR